MMTQVYTRNMFLGEPYCRHYLCNYIQRFTIQLTFSRWKLEMKICSVLIYRKYYS